MQPLITCLRDQLFVISYSVHDFDNEPYYKDAKATNAAIRLRLRLPCHLPVIVQRP